jgi:hypothetical protein
MAFLAASIENVRAALPEGTPEDQVREWFEIWRDYFRLHVDYLCSREYSPTEEKKTALKGLIARIHQNVKSRLDHASVRDDSGFFLPAGVGGRLAKFCYIIGYMGVGGECHFFYFMF